MDRWPHELRAATGARKREESGKEEKRKTIFRPVGVFLLTGESLSWIGRRLRRGAGLGAVFRRNHRQALPLLFLASKLHVPSFVYWHSIPARFQNIRRSSLYQKLAAVVLVLAVAFTAIGWRRYQANGAHPQTRVLVAPQVGGLAGVGVATVTPPVQAIIGRWMAARVATPMGPMKIELVLRGNGSCHLNVWTRVPFAAQLKNVDGKYAIRDGRLCSRLLKSGGCEFWVHDGKLLVEYKPGQIVVFHRETVAAVFKLNGAPSATAMS